MVQILQQLAVFLTKTSIFRQIFGETVEKNYNSGP
jgi:hypothetical protein